MARINQMFIITYDADSKIPRYTRLNEDIEYYLNNLDLIDSVYETFNIEKCSTSTTYRFDVSYNGTRTIENLTHDIYNHIKDKVSTITRLVVIASEYAVDTKK